MEIILLRHFQTQGNIKKQYIGRTDEPLAEAAGREAVIKRRQQECRGTEIVVASPMRRCVQTAALLFPDKVPVLCEKMRECDFGTFEGKSYEELKTNPEYQAWLDSGGTLPFPEGEDHEVFKSRCVEGFWEMTEELFEKQIEKAAMVVHGGTIMAILSAIDSEKRTFYDWQPENGGGYRVVLMERAGSMNQMISGEIEKL